MGQTEEAQALNAAGGAWLRQGRLDEAAAAYRDAAAAAPGLAEPHYNLAIVLTRQNRLPEAAASYERATALRPAYAEAHANLGSVYRRLGRLDEAVAACRRALALRPAYPIALNTLGNALAAQGDLDAAAEAFTGALALKPDYAEACHNLGMARRGQGRLDEAAAAYARALALKPDVAEWLNNLGATLLDLGRDDEAQAALRRALALKPAYTKALYNLGVALQQAGHLDEACAAFRHALALKPDYPEALHNLASLKALSDNAGMALLEGQLRASVDRPPRERSVLLFALAKTLEDRGDFDGAFAAMAAANALHRRELDFDIGMAERRMEEIARTFDTELFARLKGAGAPSARPIFVVGLARSGTTLAEQILAAHPMVKGAGELRIFGDLVARQGTEGSPFPAWARTLAPADCRRLGQAYLGALPLPGPSEAGITDKAISSLDHLGLIRLVLPEAPIIMVRRDPRDVALSCFATRFAEGHDYAYELAELGRYVRAGERLMSHWRRTLPKGSLLEVPYEALAQDLAPWARLLVDRCGLPWDDACLRFYDAQRPVRTASFAQVRRPIHANSVGRWRRFERHLGPLLEALGDV